MFNHAAPPRAPEDPFRQAMLSSGVGMAIVDLEGRWLEVNPALERMFGHAAADLRGRAASELADPADRDSVGAAFARALAGTAPAPRAAQRYRHRSGALVWAQADVVALRDADGQPQSLFVQLHDVSAQREAEQALQARNRALEQRVAEATAALQALTRQQEAFAYGISHDLRAPLRAIDSFAALLAGQARDALDDSSRDYLDRIRAAAGRMGILIDELLQLSRATRAEYKVEAVDLSLLADWAGAELRDAEPARAADIDVDPGLLVAGDERQLKLLLSQLLHNAWKFSRDGERVRIEVDGEQVGDRVHVRIRDHGAGFDMRYADKLFEPFQRLHGLEQGGGNGIGLAIAQRIVERHGGRIHAESEPGHGSTFHLDLPAASTLVADAPESIGSRT